MSCNLALGVGDGANGASQESDGPGRLQEPRVQGGATGKAGEGRKGVPRRATMVKDGSPGLGQPRNEARG
jgi:hypothetical protein